MEKEKLEDKTHHWVDLAAKTVIKEKGDKKRYILASGITPSEIIHIGHFRELITVELVNRALRLLGKETHFFHFWDDYDVFTTVPENMPKKRMLTKYLDKPLSSVPDPFGDYLSYAENLEKKFEASLEKVGIYPHFIYQTKEYKQKKYAKEVQKALMETDKIRSIINSYRKIPLSDKWLPIVVFCEVCKSSDVEIDRFNENDLSYICKECGYKATLVILESSSIKLRWRVDWPMRWRREEIDFEPGGKDHSTYGGSFDTGKEIVKKVYEGSEPSYMVYEFISVKGMGQKESKKIPYHRVHDKIHVVTLEDALDVYEPEVLRWIFTSYKPNVEFAISFDLDVFKIYEDYDRLEKAYFEEGETNDPKKLTARRAYELAQIDEIPKRRPYQPLFRQLCNFIQIYDFNFDRVRNRLKKEIHGEEDERKLENRCACASFWIKNYAPEEFKFSVLERRCSPINFSQTEINLLKTIKEFLKNNSEASEELLSDALFEAVRSVNLQLKEGFKVFYTCLIGRTVGPNLAHLMNAIGYDRVLKLIDF